MTPRKEIIGDCELWLGDCREVFNAIESVDCVITDPPWGLGELRGTTSILRNRNAYDVFDDTEQNVRDNIIPAFNSALAVSFGRGLVTPGQNCMFFYPRPRAIGGFYCPAAVGMSPWGFAGYNPVLFYGKDPRDGKGQNSVMTTLTEAASTDLHPCAKPMKAMLWMVGKGSMEGETVLGPFMGSCTTGVACVRLGRKFIGIEISPNYFDIACRRIEEACRQPDMLVEYAKPKQIVMEGV